ncbi:predicted protein [Methanosarcina acetivorans C2A]|uniref:Uncharacterized protein n=1 Tax=Methanosarcina acetivorans (strain ATCC 35395 / DSM 2834 / JCM 12185 / C2A) TaxID=188937 RepID=Q8TT84_METAC|nr:predicted protein [Methanosarcina acetivorans C2A]
MPSFLVDSKIFSPALDRSFTSCSLFAASFLNVRALTVEYEVLFYIMKKVWVNCNLISFLSRILNIKGQRIIVYSKIVLKNVSLMIWLENLYIVD